MSGITWNKWINSKNVNMWKMPAYRAQWDVITLPALSSYNNVKRRQALNNLNVQAKIE